MPSLPPSSITNFRFNLKESCFLVVIDKVLICDVSVRRLKKDGKADSWID
jgi:hypothetical protein